MLLKHLTLDAQERSQVEIIIDRIFENSRTTDMNGFLEDVCMLSHDLPERIRRFFYEFKLLESACSICIKNSPIDQSRLGATPMRLNTAEIPNRATREEILLTLYSSLLGEVFAWSTQMDGRIINDIMPLRDYEDKMISLGSRYLFDLHSEDAFHAFPPDYFGLLCLRNPDRVATILSAVEDLDLDQHIKKILFEPRYILKPNIIQRVTIADSDYRPMPILFGDKTSPYIRINTISMHAVDGDEAARNALAILIQALKESMVDVVLEPGDAFYVDNYKAVHGRRPYQPRYDGTDRWLKRIYLTNDLRKSRSLRHSTQSRIIAPLGAPS